MTGLFNPDNNWEAGLLAFVALCGMLSLVLPVWITARKNSQKLNQINDQVSNSHNENLRDEITRGFRELRQDIGGLREEIRTERQERIAGDRVRDLSTTICRATAVGE